MSESPASLARQRALLRSLGFAFLEVGYEPPQGAAAVPPTTNAPPAARQQPVTGRTKVERPVAPPPVAPPPPAEPEAAPPEIPPKAAPLSSAERARRVTELESIASLITACTACPLHLGRAQPVIGEGDPEAQVFVVCEVPGEEDDAEGRPYPKGEAAELLTKMLAAMGHPRQKVFLTHAVKCRPVGGNHPSPDQLHSCRAHLMRQIDVVQPRVVLCFGPDALGAVLPDAARRFASVRGKWLSLQGIPVMATFAPEYVQRLTDRKKTVWGDLQKVMAALTA